MKIYRLYIIVSFNLIVRLAYSQDTLIVQNKYHLKIGFKYLFDRSKDYSTPYEVLPTNSYGLQVVYKINNSCNNIESGIYLLDRASSYYYHYITTPYTAGILINITYSNIHIPLTYRFENRFIYIFLGGYLNILVNSYSDNQYFYSIVKTYGVYSVDRGLNYGYTGGLGFEKELFKRYSLYCEYGMLQDITSSKEGRVNFSGGYLNHGFRVGVNYKL